MYYVHACLTGGITHMCYVYAYLTGGKTKRTGETGGDPQTCKNRVAVGRCEQRQVMYMCVCIYVCMYDGDP